MSIGPKHGPMSAVTGVPAGSQTHPAGTRSSITSGTVMLSPPCVSLTEAAPFTPLWDPILIAANVTRRKL